MMTSAVFVGSWLRLVSAANLIKGRASSSSVIIRCCHHPILAHWHVPQTYLQLQLFNLPCPPRKVGHSTVLDQKSLHHHYQKSPFSAKCGNFLPPFLPLRQNFDWILLLPKNDSTASKEKRKNEPHYIGHTLTLSEMPFVHICEA